METKVCSVCGKEKPLSAFPKNHATKCKACMSLEAKQRIEKQKQAEEEYQKRISTLDEFSSEELLETLYRRGYRGNMTIDNHSMSYNESMDRFIRMQQR